MLHVAIPPLEIRGERLLHVAVDGSLYEAAQPPDGALIDMPEVAGDLQLAPTALLAAGPGAGVAAAARRSPSRGCSTASRPRPAAGLRSCTARCRCGANPAASSRSRRRASALWPSPPRSRSPAGPAFRPFQRLTWTGSDPRSGTWTALDRNGQPVGADAVAAEYADVAAQREADPDRVALAVRFECSESGATLCPGEIAWSADDGRTVLIHLPQLDAEPLAADAPWPAEATFGFASEAVRVGEDGSTWASESTAGRRVALGEVAPIAEAAGLRRRRVRGRRLCAWDREDWTASPPETLALTQRGRLDVDVLHGLFAFSADEPPQSWPAGPGALIPPNVTTDYEEGATMHIGARPAAREPVLDVRLARPTRLVSRSGTLHPDAPADWHTIPRYDSLQAALAAISARWQALTPADAGDVSEVVQFEDSATYPGEGPVWPAAPTDAAVRAATRLSLTIQAAERERPTVLVDPAQDWALPAQVPQYASLTLRGIGLGGDRLDGHDLAARRAGRGRALQRAPGREPARVRRPAGRNTGDREAL